MGDPKNKYPDRLVDASSWDYSYSSFEDCIFQSVDTYDNSKYIYPTAADEDVTIKFDEAIVPPNDLNGWKLVVVYSYDNSGDGDRGMYFDFGDSNNPDIREDEFYLIDGAVEQQAEVFIDPVYLDLISDYSALQIRFRSIAGRVLQIFALNITVPDRILRNYGGS